MRVEAVMRQLAFVILICGSITAFAAEEITVIGWNAESGDAKLTDDRYTYRVASISPNRVYGHLTNLSQSEPFSGPISPDGPGCPQIEFVRTALILEAC